MNRAAVRIASAVIFTGATAAASLGALQVDSASAQSGDNDRHTIQVAGDPWLVGPEGELVIHDGSPAAAGDFAQADDGSSTQQKGPVTAFGKCQAPGKCTIGLKITIRF